jgi:hypothetical protein
VLRSSDTRCSAIVANTLKKNRRFSMAAAGYLTSAVRRHLRGGSKCQLSEEMVFQFGRPSRDKKPAALASARVCLDF